MNKLQPSPSLKAGGTPLHQSIAQWGTPPASVEGTKFFRSWMVYDFDLEVERTRGRVNWNLITGVAFMLAVSAAGWAGIAWVVAHFWK